MGYLRWLGMTGNSFPWLHCLHYFPGDASEPSWLGLRGITGGPWQYARARPVLVPGTHRSAEAGYQVPGLAVPSSATRQQRL